MLRKIIILWVLFALPFSAFAKEERAQAHKQLSHQSGLQSQPQHLEEARLNAPTLNAFIQAGVANSQALEAANSQERVVEIRKALAETGYLPNIQAEAIDSSGFPGSTGALGITGLMGSPYRSGYGYGITVTEMLWDFGRTSGAVDVARAQIAAQKGLTVLAKLDVMRGALDTYVQCALARNERETWQGIAELSAVVTREIDKFVRTGQRSVVERLLAKTQNDEALREIAILDRRIELIRQRMSVISGWSIEKNDCQTIEFIPSAGALSDSAQNPYILQADLNLNLAQAQVQEAKAGFWPKLNALASVGQLEDARLVSQQNYSLGVGLTFPLFDSNITRKNLEQAHLAVEQRQFEVLAMKQTVSQVNLKFDEEIEAAKVELEHLREELKDSRLAVEQARSRYESMKGSLVDLREAIRNLEAEQIQAGKGQARLIQVQQLKNIYNGQ